MADGDYSFSKGATGYDVVVTPGSPPPIPLTTRIGLIYCGGVMGGGMILVGLVLILGGARGSFGGGVVGVLLGALVSVGSYLIYDRVWVKRQRLHREQTAFAITPTELRIAGKSLTFPGIDRFTLRNHLTRQEQSIGSPTAGAGKGFAAMGEAIGARWIARLARTSWRVDVEAGGVASTLGCGLDQATARGLMGETLEKIAELRAA